MIPTEFTKVESKLKKFHRKGAEYIGTFNIEAKRCKMCREWKTLEHFTIVRERKDGLGYVYQPVCKDCDSLRSRMWQKKKLKLDPSYNKKRCKKFRKEIGLWYGRLYKLSYDRYGRSFEKLTRDEQSSLVIHRLYKLKKRGIISDERCKELFELLDEYNTVPRIKISTHLLEEIFLIKLQ